jgi:outer membrane protein OmpA-like peptidoglycan-associated protein
VQVLDIPNTTFGRSNKIHIEVLGTEDPSHIDENAPVWLTNIRVAGGGNSLGYDELLKTGRLATHGIVFVVASARIRPESAPTLRSIGEMLKALPDLKLSIEGHTDNVGLAADNQILSKRRAAAVVAWLSDNYGIAPARLTAIGFGSTRPIAPNVSTIGRQRNRRVELVKQ